MIIAKLDRNLAKRVPEGVFESPLLIVTEALFTRGEKIATLERWRQALQNGAIAAREVDQKRVLAEIDEALRLTAVVRHVALRLAVAGSI